MKVYIFSCTWFPTVISDHIPAFLQQSKAKSRSRSSTMPGLLTTQLVQASLVATLQLEPFQEVVCTHLHICINIIVKNITGEKLSDCRGCHCALIYLEPMGKRCKVMDMHFTL